MPATTTAIRECRECGADIAGLRSDARFCSSTCRARRFRLKCPPCGWCSRKIGPGRRYGRSRYCSSACERADQELRVATETARKTLTGPTDRRSKGIMPGAGTDACTRCGSSVAYRDEDGRWCFTCGRLREAAA